MRAEITLTVDNTLGVVEAHAIADEAQHQLIHRVPRLDDATVQKYLGPPAGRAPRDRAVAWGSEWVQQGL